MLIYSPIGTFINQCYSRTNFFFMKMFCSHINHSVFVSFSVIHFLSNTVVWRMIIIRIQFKQWFFKTLRFKFMFWFVMTGPRIFTDKLGFLQWSPKNMFWKINISKLKLLRSLFPIYQTFQFNNYFCDFVNIYFIIV